MGLPVGMDFVFNTSGKTPPPYSRDDLATVEYRNSAMPSGAPESLGGAMLQLSLDSSYATVTFGYLSVDGNVAASARKVDWGDGSVNSLAAGALDVSWGNPLSHTYVNAGTYYVRFTDCLNTIGIGADSIPSTYTLKQALRRAVIPEKVTTLAAGCFQNADYMDQDVLVLPGVTVIASYVFGSMSSVSKAVRVLSMPRVTRCRWNSFYYGSSIEVLCVDGLTLVESGLWSMCPRLKWVLVRGKTCRAIQNDLPSLFNDTTSVRGIVGSDGYILNKELILNG